MWGGISWSADLGIQGRLCFPRGQYPFREEIFPPPDFERAAEGLILHFGSIQSAPADRIAKELETYCAPLEPGLIVIDPLFRAVTSRDANDYIETTRITEPFQRLARNLNAHVMLVHHARKGENTGFEGSLGSMGLLGGVDDNLMLESHGGRSAILCRGRYVEPSKVYFRSEDGRLCACKESEGKESIRAAILNLLQDGSRSRMAIAEAVGGRAEDLGPLLRSLEADGSIISEGRGTRGSPTVFRLVSHLCNPVRETNSGGLE